MRILENLARLEDEACGEVVVVCEDPRGSQSGFVLPLLDGIVYAEDGAEAGALLEAEAGTTVAAKAEAEAEAVAEAETVADGEADGGGSLVIPDVDSCRGRGRRSGKSNARVCDH
jgi:hypothetical protein